MTRNAICKKTVSEDYASVYFAFSNDVTEYVNVADFPDHIQKALAQYGLSQKLGDKYAGSKTAEEAVDSFKLIRDQLMAGDWKAASAAIGPTGGKTVRALFNIGEADKTVAKKLRSVLSIEGDWTLDAVRGQFVAATPELKKSISTAKEVKQEMARMSMEEADAAETSILG